MDLEILLKILKRKMWILILVPILAASAAIVFSLSLEKKYRSSALLSTGFTTNEAIQVVDERVDLWAAGVKFDNMIERMNSELVLSLLTYKLLLHDLKNDSVFRHVPTENGLGDTDSIELDSIINLLNGKYQKMEILTPYNSVEAKVIKLSENYGYAGWMIKKKLGIYRAKSTDFVEINFVSENPYLSAFIVNTLGEEYIRFDSYVKSGISKESLIFFSELVDEKKKILDEKIAFVDRYKLTNNPYGEGLAELKSGQIIDYEILKQEKLDEVRSKTLALADIDEQLNGLKEGSGSTLSNTNITILQIRSKINELNQVYVGGGSTDKKLLNSILDLRNQLQAEMNKLNVNSGSSSRLTKEELEARKRQTELELSILSANLVSLEKQIGILKQNVTGIASGKSVIESMNREVENARDEYLMAVDKYNTERNKSLLSKSQISIYQRGQPNGSPESSKTIIITGLAFMASFSLCVFIIVFIEFIDPRLKNPSKFESVTGLSLLGSINDVGVKNINLKTLYEGKSKSESKERFKQFIRKIRFEIQESGARVILVTSTKSLEGKTFVILSLAYSLSLLNKRILIIDTNFKNNSLTNLLLAKPELHRMLQQENDLKLIGEASHSEDKRYSIISNTSDRNIDIIGSRQGFESPSEILTDKNFRTMIDQFSNDYDYIFLEGAALNEYSDTKELVGFVDKVLLVVSADATIKKVDRDSIRYIVNLKDVYLGSILNKIDNLEFK